VAVNGRYVYWANYGSGTIARANLDGANVEKRFITGADEPIGIAVDSGHVYWTNAGLDPGSGTIGRANLDGSHVNQHFIKAGNPTGGLAVDTGYVYWTHRYWNHDYTSVGDAIGRANLDGSHVERHFIDARTSSTAFP
jgi:virginiamycin B lyase